MRLTNRPGTETYEHPAYRSVPGGTFSGNGYPDTLSTHRVSPWPIALRVTSAVLALTLVVCFAFPNG